VPRHLRSLLLALAALAGIPSAARADTAAPVRPNVLLVTVDTLRADHLGAYGYGLPTSPHLDALAAAGVRLEALSSTAPETAPATASILTGLYQPQHRVADNRDVLAADVTTLAERLRAAGYASAGFVGNQLVGAAYGFNQGFQAFEEFSAPLHERADARGVDQALAWLAGAPASPWLLWLHLMDPHGPYAPAPHWNTLATYPPDAFGGDPAIPVGLGNFGLGIIPRYQAIPGETRLSAYVRRYDGEIRSTDAQIGRLLAGLGDPARTLVVVTADHGEGLTEHREYLQHGWFVYETTVRIPLIARWPGRLPAGATVATPASAVDLVPTILDLALGTVPADAAFAGTSFAGDLTGAAPRAEGTVAFAAGARENHPFSVREGRWKLIHTEGDAPPVPASRAGLKPLDAPERFELYDLEVDPGETRNLAADEPARRRALAERVRGFRRTFRMAGYAW